MYSLLFSDEQLIQFYGFSFNGVRFPFVVVMLLLFLFSAYIVRISKGQVPGRRKQGNEIPITCGKVSMS